MFITFYISFFSYLFMHSFISSVLFFNRGQDGLFQGDREYLISFVFNFILKQHVFYYFTAHLYYQNSTTLPFHLELGPLPSQYSTTITVYIESKILLTLWLASPLFLYPFQEVCPKHLGMAQDFKWFCCHLYQASLITTSFIN